MNTSGDAQLGVYSNLLAYVVGNNMALTVLQSETLSVTVDEAAAIARLLPKTLPVDKSVGSMLLENQEAWVLKTAFGSGGAEVTLGRFCSKEQWRSAINSAIASPTIVQRFQEIPELPVVCRRGQETCIETMYANWNPWIFGGRYSGAVTRVGTTPIVSIHGGGALLPAITVADHEE